MKPAPFPPWWSYDDAVPAPIALLPVDLPGEPANDSTSAGRKRLGIPLSACFEESAAPRPCRVGVPLPEERSE